MSYSYQPSPQQPPGTFPCPRCGTPVRQGVAACPNCNTPLYAAAPPPVYGAPPTYGPPPVYGAPYSGAAAAYAAGGAYYAHVNKAKRDKHKQEAGAGAALLALGLIITLGTMAAGGGSFLLLYGPIIFGFIYLVKGLGGLASTPK